MSLATPGCVQELQTASHASLIYPGGVCLFREPDAVTPPVRFDEREQETELGQTGLRRAKRKPSPTATGRLRPLRLFSTLPQIPSGKADECNRDFMLTIGAKSLTISLACAPTCVRNHVALNG